MARAKRLVVLSRIERGGVGEERRPAHIGKHDEGIGIEGHDSAPLNATGKGHSAGQAGDAKRPTEVDAPATAAILPRGRLLGYRSSQFGEAHAGSESLISRLSAAASMAAPLPAMRRAGASASSFARSAISAGATSSASTKLIHGGLRYLEHYDFRLVRESLVEREVLLRAAPHLIRPIRLVLPAPRRPASVVVIRLGPVRLRSSDGRPHAPGDARTSISPPIPSGVG